MRAKIAKEINRAMVIVREEASDISIQLAGTSEAVNEQT